MPYRVLLFGGAWLALRIALESRRWAFYFLVHAFQKAMFRRSLRLCLSMFFHMEIGFGQTVLFCCGVCVLCGWFGLHGRVCAVVGWRCLFDVCVYELVMATDPIGRGGVGLC